MAKTSNLPEEAGGGKPQSRQALYSKVSAHAPKAIETLIELLESRQPSVRIAAARTLLNKALPDLKAIEVTGEEKAPLKVVLRMDHESLGLPDRSGTVST